MLHIILLILKIIGLIIGCVFGLLLLALCLILFVPVRYSVSGSYLNKKAEVSARLTWLLHAVSVRAAYGQKNADSDVKLSVKIMGITLFDTEQKKAPEKKKQKKSSKRNEEKTVDYTNTIDEVKEEKKAAAKNTEKTSEASVSESGGIQAKETVKDSEIKREKGQSESEQTTKRPSGLAAVFEKLKSLYKKLKEIPLKIKAFFGKFKAKLCGLGQKISSLCRKKDRLLKILSASENRAAFGFLKRSLLKVLRHILPTKICGKVRFGMEDPEKTGSMLAKAAWLYPFYDGKLEIEPDFEKEIFEAELFLAGRIQAFTLLLTGIKIVLNKDLRRILSEVKHL